MRRAEAPRVALGLTLFHTSSGNVLVGHPLVDCTQDSATALGAAALHLESVGVPQQNLRWSTIS